MLITLSKTRAARARKKIISIKISTIILRPLAPTLSPDARARVNGVVGQVYLSIYYYIMIYNRSGFRGRYTY